MADNVKKLTIRMSGEDAGVGRIMRDIRREAADTMRSVRTEAQKPVLGPEIRPRFDVDTQLARKEAARIIREMRDEAARHTIQVRAEAIVESARARVFGENQEEKDEEKSELPGDVLGATGERRSELSGRGVIAGSIRGVEKFTTGLRVAAKAAAAVTVAVEATNVAFALGSVINAHISGTLEDQVAAAKKLESAMKSIPLVGEKIVSIGAAINEAFTGSVAAAARMTAEAERTNAVIEARVAILKMGEASHLRTLDLIRSIREQTQLIGMSGSSREIAQLDIQLEERRRKARADADPEKSEEITKLTEQIKAIDTAARKVQVPDKLLRRDLPTANEESAQAAIKKRDQERTDALAQVARFDADRLALEKQQKTALVRMKWEEQKTLSEIEKFGEASRSQIQNKATEDNEKAHRDRAQKNRAGVKKMVDEAAKIERDAAQKVTEAARKSEEMERNRERLARSIAEARIEGLETEGKLGDKNAEIEAKRLQIAENYRRKRREIIEAMKEEGVTAAQREEAERLLGALPGQQRMELDRLGTSSLLPQAAAAQSGSAFIRGSVAQSSEAEAQQQIAKNTRDQADRASKQVQLTEKLLRRTDDTYRLIEKMAMFGNGSFISLK